MTQEEGEEKGMRNSERTVKRCGEFERSHGRKRMVQGLRVWRDSGG